MLDALIGNKDFRRVRKSAGPRHKHRAIFGQPKKREDLLKDMRPQAEKNVKRGFIRQDY